MARRWNRFEVVQLVADQNRRGATISRRTAAYPFRWMADSKGLRLTPCPPSGVNLNTKHG